MKISIAERISKIPSKYYFIISFFIASLCMYLSLAYSEVLSTGRYCLMDGDLFENYIPAIREFARDVIKGESIWFSWSRSFGMNTSFVNAMYVFSPINVLYLIFYNVDVNIVTAAVIIIKTGLAASAFQLYVFYSRKVSGFSSLVFSIFYALCSFQFSCNIVNLSWMEAMYITPIILLLIDKLFEKNKWIILCVTYFYLFTTFFYMGYIVGGFSFLYFIFKLLDKNISFKRTCLIKNYFLSVIIAIGMSCFVWLPVLLFMVNNSSYDAVTVETIETNIVDLFGQFLFGQNNSSHDLFPNVYSGILVLIIFPLYFLNLKVNMYEKIKWGFLLVFLLISCMFKPLYLLCHAFDSPDGWYFRFTFLVSLIICVISCEMFDYMKEKYILSSLLFGCSFLMIGISDILWLEKRNLVFDNSWLYLSINVAIVFVWCGILKLWIKNKSIHKKRLRLK